MGTALGFPRIVMVGAAMVTGPGGELAASAAGRGYLRVSDAEREQVIGALKAAFVRGVLAKDEFDLRVGQAFASRTYAELAVVTAGLPRRARRSPSRPGPRGPRVGSEFCGPAGCWRRQPGFMQACRRLCSSRPGLRVLRTIPRV